jgi:CDP-diglyceride synthetase
MKRIITALILIPVVLVLVFLGPWWQWLFTMAVAAVAALAAWEFLGLAENAGANRRALPYWWLFWRFLPDTSSGPA